MLPLSPLSESLTPPFHSFKRILRDFPARRAARISAVHMDGPSIPNTSPPSGTRHGTFLFRAEAKLFQAFTKSQRDMGSLFMVRNLKRAASPELISRMSLTALILRGPGGHVHMTSEKFSDLYFPLSPLSLSHSRNLSVLSSAFGGPPSPSQCRHHLYMPP